METICSRLKTVMGLITLLLFVQSAQALELEPGVTFRLFDIQEPMQVLTPLVLGQIPNIDELRPEVDFSTLEAFSGFKEQFVVEVSGFLLTEVPGKYVLRLISDDGSILKVDDRVVIQNDGLHPLTAVDAELELKSGLHPFLIRMFQLNGGAGLIWKWKVPGSHYFKLVNESVLRTEKGVVRVTSLGKKNILNPGGPLRPGNGMPLEGTNPAFDLVTIHPKDFQPRVGGMTFLPDGRMALVTWERGVGKGKAYLLDGIQGRDAANVKVKEIASGLTEPLGIATSLGHLYVSQKDQITELISHRSDEVIDEFKTVAKGWHSDNPWHFTFDLLAQDGFLYSVLSTAIGVNERGLNGIDSQNRGSLMKIDPLTGKIEYLAGGLRNANGIGIGPEGPIALSPSQPLLIKNGEFAGQMYLADVTYGGIKRIYLEKLNGHWQGGVVQFTHGLEAGVNRISWGPDGALYAGCIGDGSGNWSWQGKLFGLQKLVPNGRSPFEIHSVQLLPDGFNIRFTQPIDLKSANSPKTYTMRQWHYEPTMDYGGPNIGEETLSIRSVKVSADQKSVRLTVGDLKPGSVIYIAKNLKSVTGEKLWAAETWYNLLESARP